MGPEEEAVAYRIELLGASAILFHFSTKPCIVGLRRHNLRPRQLPQDVAALTTTSNVGQVHARSLDYKGWPIRDD